MIFQNNRNNSPASRAGFSLIELLVAIGIIAVLAVIGIGVGMKVLGSSKEKATKANMAIIMNAIDTFHDQFDEYPGDSTLSSLDPDQTVSFSEELGSTNMSVSSHLWGYTERTNYTPPKSRDKIKVLPGEIVNRTGAFNDGGTGDTSTVTITFNFMDKFGNPMRYSANGGLGGTPVIISAGPDGKFGNVKDSSGAWVDTDSAADAEDNIRSDK